MTKIGSCHCRCPECHSRDMKEGAGLRHGIHLLLQLYWTRKHQNTSCMLSSLRGECLSSSTQTWTEDSHAVHTDSDWPRCAGNRLASGDSEGRVVVWDIATATPVIALEDPLTGAQLGGKRAEPGKGGAVRGLAWVCSNAARLAIVLANGMFLVWDVAGTPPQTHPRGCTAVSH